MKALVYFLALFILYVKCSEDNEKHKCGGDISCLHAGGDEQCGGGDNAKPNVGKDSAEATNIAQKAAQEAKAAQGAQQQAAQQASHQVKEQLAEKAIEAAKAAEAALAGKETIVEELDHEIQQAEVVESEETEHINALQTVLGAETKALADAKAEGKILAQLLHIVENNIRDAEQVEAGVQQELTEKQQLVETAKKRKEDLSNQLGKARQDLSKTKTAAKSAEQAATEAESNVGKNRRRKHIFYNQIRK